MRGEEGDPGPGSRVRREVRAEAAANNRLFESIFVETKDTTCDVDLLGCTGAWRMRQTASRNRTCAESHPLRLRRTFISTFFFDRIHIQVSEDRRMNSDHDHHTRSG